MYFILNDKDQIWKFSSFEAIEYCQVGYDLKIAFGI
jgi:hypothetical protein